MITPCVYCLACNTRKRSRVAAPQSTIRLGSKMLPRNGVGVQWSVPDYYLMLYDGLGILRGGFYGYMFACPNYTSSYLMNAGENW